MTEILWSFEETRKRIKKSEHGLRWLVRKRAIPLVKIGNRIYFQPEKVRKWIEAHAVPSKER